MWNTYRAGALNCVLHLPDLACVRIGIYDNTQKFLLSDMLWQSQSDRRELYRNVRRFGVHAEDGSYFDIDLCYLDFTFKLEFSSDGNSFVYRVTPLTKRNEQLYFYISTSILCLGKGTISTLDDGFFISTDKGNYQFVIRGNINNQLSVNTELPGILVDSANPFYITCNKEDNEQSLSQELNTAKEIYFKSSSSSDGWIKEVSDALQKGLAWNTIYDHTKKRICSPVSRAWCVQNGSSFGSYVLFEWDTFFSALMGASYSKSFAVNQIKAIFQEITSDGMIPNFGSQRGGSPDRSQPPVGSYCMLKLYRQFHDITLLEEFYDSLCQWNAWWFKNRDGNKDGLLEWGSNPNLDGRAHGFFDDGNTMLCAMYESGLDNSPMYDNVTYNTDTHTMEMADVGLNALYALDCKSLASISNILNQPKKEAYYTGEYKRIKELMNQTMYDSDVGMYCNLHWNGNKDYRFSPTNFYPLLAEIPSAVQAKSMLQKHLLNENEFWGEYVIPSIAKNCTSYFDQDYWRGRIWGPMNYLVYEGLKQYQNSDLFNQTAYEFADKSLQLFLKEWMEENHIHENYNSMTGDGDDKLNADPFYTWGALLAYLPLCELIYVSPWNGIRLGNFLIPGCMITNYIIDGSLYTLNTQQGFYLEKDGMKLMESDSSLVVDEYLISESNLTAVIKSQTHCRVTLFPQKDILHCSLKDAWGTLLYSGSFTDIIVLNI